MLKKIAAFSICLIILLYSTAQACWVFFPIGELIQKSDTIMIGYVEGDIGEAKDNDGMIKTYWKVKVSHYFKGQGAYKEYAVATPGSTSPFSNVKSSIDYTLTTKIYALFFLSNSSPLTPRGVVYLNVSDMEKLKAAATGEEIAKLVDTSDPQFTSEEQKEILEFIKSSKVTAATEENTVKVEKSNLGVILIVTLIAASALVVGIVGYRKIKA